MPLARLSCSPRPLFVLVPAISLLFGAPLAAAPRVEARPGDRVRVSMVDAIDETPIRRYHAVPPVPDDRGYISGTLAAADADSITLVHPDRERPIRIARSGVARLEVSRGSTGARNGWIGAGVGLAAGLAVARASYENCSDARAPFDPCHLSFVVPLVTTPLGALLGLATGGDRWVEAIPRVEPIGSSRTERGVRLAWTVGF